MDLFEELGRLVADGQITPEQLASIAKIATRLQALQERYSSDDINDLQKKVRSLRSQSKYRVAAAQLARMSSPENRRRYYSTEDLMTELDIFKEYPFVSLDTFFTHPNEEDVTFRKSGRPDLREKLPIVLNDMLPGCFSSRYRIPYKIISGRLNRLGGDIYVTSDLEESVKGEVVSEIPEKDLPTDFPRDLIKLPTGSKSLRILKPQILKYSDIPSWWTTAPGVFVCPSCSRVPDGDELGELHNRFCPECSSTAPPHPAVTTQTVPETFSKLWYTISYSNVSDASKKRLLLEDGEQVTITPDMLTGTPSFAASLFSSIGYSSELIVTRFSYALQRRYTSQQIITNPITIYFRYGDRPIAFGEKLQTDGFIFRINQEFLNSFVQSSVTSGLSKSILVQFLFYIVERSLRADVGYFGCLRIFRSLLWCLLEDNKLKIPDNVQMLHQAVENVLKNTDRITSTLLRLPPNLTPQQLNSLTSAIKEKFSTLTSFGAQECEVFLRRQILHSLAHTILDSVQEVSGSSEDQTSYFFDHDRGEIYVFDAIEGGSGFCECALDNLYIPFSYRNAKIRQRLGRFDTTPTFLPTQDCLTTLERNLFECPDHTTYRILFEIAKSVSENDLSKIIRDQRVRTDTVKDLISKHRLLLSEQGPLIEYNLRIGLPLFLKLTIEKLGIECYEDLFALSQVPELIYERLRKLTEEKRLANILHHESDERRVEEIRDLLSLCYVTCPTCSLPSSCILGTLETEFHLNQRLLNMFYRFSIDDQTLSVKEDYEKTLSHATQILNEKKSVYLELDEKAGFDPIYPLIGVRDGTEYKIKIQDDEDMVYRTVNFKSIQTVPDFSSIRTENRSIVIPFHILAKLEQS